MSFAPIDPILEDLRQGRMIVLVDDEGRENEGDLVCAAEKVTPETVNFMTKHARGLLCVALDGSVCDRLELGAQSPVNTAQLQTAFTVSVDGHERFGIGTGVSAADRARTIQLLADEKTRPEDLSRPGHIHPLRARQGGVLVRTGQTEGGVDLCRLAGLRPAAAIIEIMNDDGSMARGPQLEEICRKHGLNICSVADVIAHRLQREKMVQRIAESPIETPEGPFHLIAYRSAVDPLPHVALTTGRVGREVVEEPVLVRVHSHDLLGDVFGESSGGQMVRRSMQKIQAAGEGAIVYLRQEGAGRGLLSELLQRKIDPPPGESTRHHLGSDAVTNVGIGSQILLDLGVRRMKLLSCHPQPYGLEGFGLQIDQFIDPTD